MKTEKLTSDLAGKLASASQEDLIDIIVEMDPGGVSTAASDKPPQERGRAIAAKKDAFQKLAEPVSNAIRGLGGEILGSVWLNNTIRARVPAKTIGHLSDLDGVSSLDLPHKIEAESR